MEGMIMILPFLALFFLLIDTCYAIFVKATLQYAVQQGVYDAVTFSGSGLIPDVQNTVWIQSLNLIPAGNVQVNFYAPASLTQTLPQTAGVNQPGNIVEVDVTYYFAPLAPLFRSGATIPFSASSASILAVYPPPSLF